MNLKSRLESENKTSKYSLNGKVPTTSLNGVGYLPLNDTFGKGTYQNYLVTTVDDNTIQNPGSQDLTPYKSKG
jgi:hypothetical protein